MTVEQKAKRFCKDFVFTYIIPSYNETKRKSGALIAEESFIAGYNECEKEHEWHYVKNGDLPICNDSSSYNDLVSVIVAIWTINKDHLCVVGTYWNKKTGKFNCIDEVYAWQYPPAPPKEIE